MQGQQIIKKRKLFSHLYP